MAISTTPGGAHGTFRAARTRLFAAVLDLEQPPRVLVLVLDLQRRVADREALLEEVLEPAPDPVAVVPRGDEHVGGEGGEAGGHLPDVQIVDLDNAGVGREGAADGVRVEVARGALE